MLMNLALIVLMALIMAWVFEKFRLPGLLGMILCGLLLGNHGLGFIDGSVLELSGDFRELALLVILIRAGLGINRQALNKIGKAAFRMSFVPGVMEAVSIWCVSYFVFDFPLWSGAVLGFVIAAVSPAVIVPQMLELKDQGYGKAREVPTLVLAGASVDDVIAITFFSAFLAIGLGQSGEGGALIKAAWSIPVSIVMGVAVGLLAGYLLYRLFKWVHLRDTRKVLIFLITAVALHHVESLKIWPFAGLLAVMAMGFVIVELYPILATRLAGKFNRAWVPAEILLFVMIGSAFDPSVAAGALGQGLLILVVGLSFRSLGVWLSLLGTELNRKERIFCILAYLPKATVQAAIGGVALERGLVGGEVILAVAVLSILITAPVGAILVKMFGPRLLSNQD